MKEELVKKLHDHFPKLFEFEYQGKTMKVYPEVGDGWYGIIYGMCSTIDRHVSFGQQRYTEAVEMHHAFDRLAFDELPTRMQALAKAGDRSVLPTIPEPVETVNFQQIKEKFGSLRVYVRSNYDEYVLGVINMAENMADRTCELTGAPGELYVQNGHYMQTRCEAVAKPEDGWKKYDGLQR